MSRTVFVLVLVAACAPSGWTDITLRYTFDVKFASFLPAEAQAQAKQAIAAALPHENHVRIKSDKAYSDAGPLGMIADYGRNEVTLVDPKTNRYATVGMSEFADKLGALQKPPAIPPEAQQMLRNMHFDVQSKKTGQIGLIQGIQSEENVITLIMQMPGMPGAASAIRMEIHAWLAQANEIRRVPALQELADYSARATKAMDPTQMIQKMLSQFPGMGDQMKEPLQELWKLGGNLMVKQQLAVYIPAMAQAMQLQGTVVPGFDANAPLTEVHMELADISTVAIPDSIFALPADYRQAPFEEVAQALVQVPPQLPPAAPKH
jgi:hypothetical protein